MRLLMEQNTSGIDPYVQLRTVRGLASSLTDQPKPNLTSFRAVAHFESRANAIHDDPCCGMV